MSCFVYKVMGLTLHDRISTQLIYRFEIAQVVARRIPKPQRNIFRFESHWLLSFIHFFILPGGGGATLRQGQTCFVMHLNGIFFCKVDLLNTVKAKVIILA